jgi:hypothetical protein
MAFIFENNNEKPTAKTIGYLDLNYKTYPKYGLKNSN